MLAGMGGRVVSLVGGPVMCAPVRMGRRDREGKREEGEGVLLGRGLGAVCMCVGAEYCRARPSA